MDWLTTDAFRLFARKVVLSDGAGALYLRRQPDQDPAVELRAVTQPHLFSKEQTRAQAARLVLALGRLGGHQNRPSDGMPGWMTLWRGWSQLQIMVAVVAKLKPPRSGGT